MTVCRVPFVRTEMHARAWTPLGWGRAGGGRASRRRAHAHTRTRKLTPAMEQKPIMYSRPSRFILCSSFSMNSDTMDENTMENAGTTHPLNAAPTTAPKNCGQNGCVGKGGAHGPGIEGSGQGHAVKQGPREGRD
jgi:hypothetical protein